MATNRYSSENLTDEDHLDARGIMTNNANVGVSIKRDAENLYYAQNYAGFLQMEMRAISPTSAQGEENNQIGINAMRRSVRKDPDTTLFERRYSVNDGKSQKIINLDSRKGSFDKIFNIHSRE
jgi:hypothetical protein